MAVLPHLPAFAHAAVERRLLGIGLGGLVLMAPIFDLLPGGIDALEFDLSFGRSLRCVDQQALG